MQYRREIDGLRAVAVLPVILFHAGFEYFSGGFIGVDVFFVISGYLIGSIIISEKRAGRFSLADFYERRARRILPALFVVLFACLPAAWLWLFPPDLQDFSNSLIAISTFVSNFFFWQTTGYFETSAELKPLLHTWSLAVEEQYYLLFPAVLLVLWKFTRQWIACVFAVIAFVSLAAAQYGTRAWPAAAFFLLSSRGWELLIGVLVAFYSFRQHEKLVFSSMLNQSAGAAGLLLIIFSIFAFDEQTAFPGVHALVPTIGTALVILFATPQTAVGKALGGRLLVGIGLISYSAYLWHQPLFAFARHASVEKPGIPMLVALSIAALALAVLTRKYVELPFRNRERFSRRQIMFYGTGCAIFFALLGGIGDWTKGFQGRLSESELRTLSFRQYDYRQAYREGSCFLTPEQTYKDFSPQCATAGDAGGTMIWGDSHAAALSYGMRSLRPHVIQYTASGCPPIKDMDFDYRSRCRQINDHVAAQVRQLKPAVIYLHADWSRYKYQSWAESIKKTIDGIHGSSSASRIVLVGPVPHWYPSLPIVMLKRNIALDHPKTTRGAVLENPRILDKNLQSIAVNDKVGFFSAIDALCSNDDECQAVVEFNGALMPTAADYGHLTAGGSVLLARKLFQ